MKKNKKIKEECYISVQFKLLLGLLVQLRSEGISNEGIGMYQCFRLSSDKHRCSYVTLPLDGSRQKAQNVHSNFQQCFQLTRNSVILQSHKLDQPGFVHWPDLHHCVCVFTSESSRGCARLSITIAINSDDSELVADPRPQALQRHWNRPTAGREESDKGVPHSFICRESEKEREGEVSSQFDGQGRQRRGMRVLHLKIISFHMSECD